MQQKQQQTKTTKHTIEFSNNTPARPRNQPAAISRVLVVRTVRNPPKWASLWDAVALCGLARVATTSTSYVRENSESNGLIGACLSIPPIVRTQHASAPTHHPTRSTPAIFRLPRRSTSQRPCRKSDGCGTHSSLSIRTLLTYAPPSAIVRRAAPLLADNPLATSRSVMRVRAARLQFGHRRPHAARRPASARRAATAPRDRTAPGWRARRPSRRRLAVHQRGELAGQPTLRRAFVRALRRRLLQFGQLLARQEREPPQVPDRRRRRRC